VGLGEATHGAHEFFAMKARLIEYLVGALGFTTVAMENGWAASRPMDDYLATGQGDPRALQREDFYGAWQTQEVLSLLAWLRVYNADPSHTAKVHFAGVDSWNVTQAAFDDVEAYLATVDPPQASRAQALYSGIRPTTPGAFVDYDGFSRLPQATKQQYQQNAQQVADLLQAHEADYQARSSAQAFAVALHSARVIVQYATLGVLIPESGTLFSSATAYAQRDAFMAENVEWLADQRANNAKMVVWAHNVHIASLRQSPNMGALLRTRYQARYLRIGTSFYQGSFTVFGAGPRVFTAPAPGADTYNFALGHAGLPLYALDMRAVPPGSVADWLQGPHALLNYGVGGEDLQMEGSLQYWFDVIIHIQQFTPSHLLQ
jgi:erythromycin esterase